MRTCSCACLYLVFLRDFLGQCVFIQYDDQVTIINFTDLFVQAIDYYGDRTKELATVCLREEERRLLIVAMAKCPVLKSRHITKRRRLNHFTVAMDQRATDHVSTVINAIGRPAGSTPEFHIRKCNLDVF